MTAFPLIERVRRLAKQGPHELVYVKDSRTIVPVDVTMRTAAPALADVAEQALTQLAEMADMAERWAAYLHRQGMPESSSEAYADIRKAREVLALAEKG